MNGVANRGLSGWAFKPMALAAGIGAVALCGSAQAGPLLFDQNVTPEVIMGDGIANGAWTVDRSNSVEVGLRAKLRHNASGLPENTFNSNGDGTYSFDAGVAPTQSFPTAVWSFEWSINSATGSVFRPLNQLTYLLSIDTDPGAGTAFSSFDPINVAAPNFFDHAFGTNATGNGDGVEATSRSEYETLIAQNNVAQNSWKPHWFISPFDPTVDGVYDFELTAFGTGGGVLASTRIQVIVGAGATTVPEPASLLLLGAGLLGLGWSRRKVS